MPKKNSLDSDSMVFERKKFRINFLIDQQLNYMKQLENKLKVKQHHDVFIYDKYNLFDYEENLKFVNDYISFPNKNEKEINDLIESYQANLIRYEAIKKLSKELDLARLKLHKAMKTQTNNLNQLRNRVKWLENEIETILLSNKNINYPIDADLGYLKVEKIAKPEIKIEENYLNDLNNENSNKETIANESLLNSEINRESVFLTEHETHMIESQAEKDEMNALMSKWEKKSNGSTDSLLDSDNDENLVEEEDEEKKELVEPEKSFAKIEQVKSDSFEKIIENNQTMNEQINQVNDVLEQKNESISLIEYKIDRESQLSFYDKENNDTHDKQIESNLVDIESQKIDSYNESETIDDMQNTKIKSIDDKKLVREQLPFYMQPHNRFEYTESSKIITASDPCSYHKLGIALTDSYIENDLRNKISSRIPIIECKEKLERDDIKFLKLAGYLENVSKKICNSSELFKFNRLNKREQTKLSLNRMKSNLDVSLSASRVNSGAVESLKDKFKNKKQSNRSLNNQQTQSASFGIYEAPPLLPALNLPNTKKNFKLTYPRIPTVYATNKEEFINLYTNFNAPQRLVNQYNLNEQTKLKLYNRTNSRENSLLNFDPNSNDSFVTSQNNQQKEDQNESKQVEWSDLKPDESPFYHSGLRFEKIKSLLKINLKSNCVDEKLDAIKHLGLLKLTDNVSIYSLKMILENPTENDLVKFESAKSLVLLGYWSDEIFDIFNRCLTQDKNEIMKNDILKSIIQAKNPQYSNIDTFSANKFINILENLTNSSNDSLALDSCICLGKLGVKHSYFAINKLNKIIHESKSKTYTSTEWHRRTLAVETLVKLFDMKDSKIINYIMSQAQNSPDWVSRCSAVKLLSHIGPNILYQSEYVEVVYKLLETRLAEDPICECRLQIGRTVKDLRFFDKILNKAIKNLESFEDDVRMKAVLSIEMLEAKQSKIIEALIDMLELDESERVRIRALKALFNLGSNNSKVVKAFNNLEKNSKLYQLLQNMREQQNGVKRNFKAMLLNNDNRYKKINYDLKT